MSLGFTACAGSEDFPENNQPSGSTTRVIEVGLSLSSSQTRTILNESSNPSVGAESFWKWEEDANEKLLLTDADGNVVTTLTLEQIQENKNLAIFHGESASEIKEDTDYLITYCGRNVTPAKEFTVKMFSNGSKAELGQSDVMSNIIRFEKEASTVDAHKGILVYRNNAVVELQKRFSIVRFKMIDDKSADLGRSYQIKGKGVYTSAAVTIGAIQKTDDGKFDAVKTLSVDYSGDGGIQNVGSAQDIYLTMAPGKNVAPIFKCTYSDNSVSYGTPGATESMVAGKIYNIGVDEEGNATFGVPVFMLYENPIQIGTIDLIDWAAGPTGEITVGGN